MAYLETVLRNPKITILAYLRITANAWKFNLSDDATKYVFVCPYFFSIMETKQFTKKEINFMYENYICSTKQKISFRDYKNRVDKFRSFSKKRSKLKEIYKPLNRMYDKFLHLFPGYIFFKGSFFLILLLLIQIPLYKKFGFDMILSMILPLSYYGTLFLCLPAFDIRYFYFLILLIPFIYSICFFGDIALNKQN
jgi:hypothetical protein